MTGVRCAILLLPLLLASCATAPTTPPDSAAARCLDLYAAWDAAARNPPSSPAAVAGFPHLRVDRFLASYRDEALSPEQRRVWVARLAGLDREARTAALGALPPALEDCSRTLQAWDLTPRRWARLLDAAVVPADYRAWQRIVGLYPITGQAVRYGAYRWRQEAHELFAPPLEALPVRGELRRYRPPAVAEPISMAGAARDALGIPLLTPAVRDALFALHAPAWEIDVAGGFDRPGAPRWQADGTPTVDPAQPVTYRYLTFSRWRGEVLAQLNYVVWFAERPREGPLDILGGPLDGLVWRVTLDAAGRPLVYDSIHPCGCYHLFFPSLELRPRPGVWELPEPPMIPQYAPRLAPGRRIVVRVESGTHYIQRVYADAAAEGTVYGLRDYRELYRLADGSVRRSLFAADGLVPGTARRERFLLWPMGIPSPGAMRERGRHAVAFVGRRHFDDPRLLEALFQPAEATP